MPYKTEKIALADAFLKRSSKLIPCQREMVLFWRDRGLSQRQLARMFHVSRRLITMILDPAKAKRNLELRIEKGGSKIYYNKAKHSAAIKSLRKYKQKLFKDQK